MFCSRITRNTLMIRTFITSRQGLSLIAILSLSTRLAAAGTYANSAHGGEGTPANGLSRTATTDYLPGNCAHCHEQHASINGNEPSPVGGPGPYLGMALEQNLCLECHKTGGSSDNGTPDDIATDMNKTHRHDGTLSDTLHRFAENFTDFTTSPHVECTDCHSPHVGRQGNHQDGTNYQGPSGNLIDTGSGRSPLEGVKGAAQGYGGATTNWSAPNQGSYSLQTATKEYEICFKCHSGANPNWASWDGVGAAEWSDVGLEFNTKNHSFHPLVGALDVAGTGSSKLAAAQLTNGWSPGDTMYCSDCHGNVGAGIVQGPHGSATKWMLDGPNTAWPYTSSTNNGTGSGTPFTLGGTTSNLFCLNCHPAPTAAASNNVHQENNHSAVACVECHIRVPHGGKVSRLINANDSGALPARYFPDGNNGGTAKVLKFSKNADKDNYAKGNCATVAGCHGATGGSETW